MRENVFDLIDRLKDVKLFVIGDVMLDVFLYGKVNRISPEAPVPVVNITNEKRVPGGAANVALNLKELGVSTTLIGLIGNDEEGVFLEKYLIDRGIKTFLIKDGRPTTVKTRIIAGSQQVVRVDKEVSHNLSDKKESLVVDYFEKHLSEFDGVIISDYAKGAITRRLIKRVVDLCKKHNKIVTVDPKIENFFYYKNVTTLTPNNKEASTATGIDIKDEKSLVKCGNFILKKLNSDSLIITRGEKGMTIFENGRIEYLPALAKEVFDVTGAGDTVISVVSSLLALGAPLKDAAILSNIAAGIVVGKIGTATVNADELKKGVMEYIEQKGEF
ncbi:D-glycero-beta-D-manno-heptose-7-phosphate kinase [Calditerrivibrio nitroreducens]|uniref:RfaE bifunctional protein n=1 Tax=Calditerrivibrio nitroreducens (strain DSM 19672 / NBRC 101217 / Yu37-1) TaxID=768670 RepID=E4TJF7_CALNY|nr:D-glycero-beta-D-manno-heptose-7-phosphate kinase [Calditerrivibrio nitroreducens]ADR19224.1 rfaE bifunctional protein [Calditerrivibrio nitroreducens DSM 19672]